MPPELCGRVLRFHPRLWCRERQAFGPGMLAAFRPVHGDLDPDAPPVRILRWFLDQSGRCLRGPDDRRLKRALGQVAGAALSF